MFVLLGVNIGWVVSCVVDVLVCVVGFEMFGIVGGWVG